MGNFRDDRRGGFHRGGRSFDRGPRQMFTATCSNCGKECQVPFRPTNGKPVYCSDCFEKMGNRGQDSRRQPPSFDQNKAQFDALNAKMDKILSLLQPKVEAPPEEVAKAPKAKKIASTKKK